jgi:hypothetical protein
LIVLSFPNGTKNLTTTPDVAIVVSRYLLPHKMSIRKKSLLSPDLIIAISAIVVSEKVVADDVKRNQV